MSQRRVHDSNYTLSSQAYLIRLSKQHKPCHIVFRQFLADLLETADGFFGVKPLATLQAYFSGHFIKLSYNLSYSPRSIAKRINSARLLKPSLRIKLVR